MRVTEREIKIGDTAYQREVPGHVRLFQAVIVSGVYDALSGKRVAINWILNDPEFEIVCELADFDSHELREKVEQFVNEGRGPCAPLRLSSRQSKVTYTNH